MAQPNHRPFFKFHLSFFIIIFLRKGVFFGFRIFLKIKKKKKKKKKKGRWLGRAT